MNKDADKELRKLEEKIYGKPYRARKKREWDTVWAAFRVFYADADELPDKAKKALVASAKTLGDVATACKKWW